MTETESLRRASARAAIEARFVELGIPYHCIEHEAAASLRECAAISERIGAPVMKNWFLTNRPHSAYCLCVVRPEARLRTSDISAQAGTSRLSFTGEEDMLALLNTTPGSVSPLGLLFDKEHRVRLLVDRTLTQLHEMVFHPCDNTHSVVMRNADFFEKFLPSVGHEPFFIDIHDFEEL